MSCPRCGADESQVIPVWEEMDRYESNEQPKFIGCTSCHRMMRTDLMERFEESTDSISQAQLSDHEVGRLKPLGNQNTDRLTLIEWQCVKGAAMLYGVTDWTAKVDRTLTMEENIGLMRKHGTESGPTVKELHPQ